MFRIVHITDIHIPPLPEMRLSEFTIKRILGYLSWHRKRKTIHDADILNVLNVDVAFHNPDHIMVSGDITNLALDAEYERAAEWLASLGAVEDVSVIPGNHDAYSRDPETAVKSFWAPFASDDDGRQGFPFVRKRGNVAVVGVSSAVWTWPFMANGRVGDNQLKELRKILSDLKEQQLCRVVMIHHPPQQERNSFRRGLSNAKDFRDVIKDAGAELVLHGHEHELIRGELDGPDGPVPVRGAGSGSASGAGHKPAAHYHVIDVSEADDKWQIEISHRQIDSVRRFFSTIDRESLQLPKH